MAATSGIILSILAVSTFYLNSYGKIYIGGPSNYHQYPPQMPTPDVYPGRYTGKGTISYLFGGRDLELYCSFQGDNLVSNIIWMKIDGPYPYYHYPPPYHCHYCKYRTFSSADYRYDVYQFGGKSVLRIRDIRPGDYGIYRCSATSQVSYSGYTETVFKIIKV